MGTLAAPPPPKIAVSQSLSSGTGIGTGQGGGSGGGTGAGVGGAIGGPFFYKASDKLTALRDQNGVVGGSAPKAVRVVDTKLHPQLVAAYDCWQAQTDKSKAAGACKLQGDTISVRVVVSGDAQAALQQLKANGFEVQSTSARRNQWVCRLTIDKLAALAELSFVEFVAPEEGKGS